MAGRILQATSGEQRPRSVPVADPPHEPCRWCDGPVDRREGEVMAKYIDRQCCCVTHARMLASDRARGPRPNTVVPGLSGPDRPVAVEQLDFGPHNLIFKQPPHYVNMPILARQEASGISCAADLCVSETGVR